MIPCVDCTPAGLYTHERTFGRLTVSSAMLASTGIIPFLSTHSVFTMN